MNLVLFSGIGFQGPPPKELKLTELPRKSYNYDGIKYNDRKSEMKENLKENSFKRGRKLEIGRPKNM